MAVTGFVACVKYLMFAFNFLFWLCGCALLGVGLWLCFEPSVQHYASASGDLQEYYIAVYVIIGIGGLMMLVGFLGCCGACMENTVLLGMFFTFLLLICVAEVGGGVWCYLNREKLQGIIESSMKDTMTMTYSTGNTVVTTAVDRLQRDLKCCGTVGPEDWIKTSFSSGDILTAVPDSCCKTERKDCGSTVGLIASLGLTIHNKGCAEALFEKLEENTVLVAGLAIGIGGVQLLGMLFSLCLCCAIRRADREKSYPI